MQKLERSAISKAAAVEWRRPGNTREATVRSRIAGAWVVIARLLRTWRRRELQRRELSVLSSRDFGDLAVPQSLINEEIRRWPWQKWSQQWSQVTNKRGHPYDGSGRTR
jgi:uncharacterized protein YjiS (DUF1127 family)